MWNAEIGETIEEALRGHERVVRSVCMSEDRKVVVSGGWDWRVRMLNGESDEAIGEPLRGHEEWIRSVCMVEMEKLLYPDRTIQLFVCGMEEVVRQLQKLSEDMKVGY